MNTNANNYNSNSNSNYYFRRRVIYSRISAIN